MTEDELFERYEGYLNPKCEGQTYEAEIDVGELHRIMQIWQRLREDAGRLINVGIRISIEDDLGTIFCDWNEEYHGLPAGTKLYAMRPLSSARPE